MQTAIEFLIENLGEYFPHEIGGINYLVKQAKQLEKQQIMEAVSFGDCRGRITTYLTDEQYYNETYGSKGSDEVGSSLEWNGEVTEGHNIHTSSQTEISDEEIEKASNEGWVALDSSRTDNWIRGAKWYREQIKKTST